MKKLVLFFLCGILATEEEHKVAEEVIKGKAELKIENVWKPKGKFILNPVEPVDSLLSETGLLRTTLDIPSLEKILFTSLYTPTSYIRIPTNYSIPESVQIPIPKIKFKIKNWKLSLLDSKGESIWEKEGKGKPPREIYWNGRKKKGGILIPGEAYTPVLYVSKKEGRKRRIVGDPLKMKSFVADFGDSAILSIEISEIFDSLSERLRDGASERLTAILNWVKSYNADVMNVHIYCNNFILREDRARILEDYLKKYIVLKKNNFKVIPLPFKEGERKYERIEINLTKTPKKFSKKIEK